MQSIECALRHAKRHVESLPAWACLLLAAAGIAGLAVIVWQCQPTGDLPAGDYLFGGQRVDKSRWGAIVQALAKSDLTEYVIDQQRIRVPRGQAARYHSAIAAAGALPSGFPSHMRDALEQNRIFESDYARRQRLRHARELDLATAIRTMEGIDDAMVQLDQIDQSGFQTQRLVTASVSVVPEEGHILDHGQVRAIGRQVAAANAGMRPEDVVVTDLRSGVSYLGGETQDAVGWIAEEHLRVKRAVERSWQQKIVQVLSFVPGARVVVAVELGADSERPVPSAVSFGEPKRMSVSVAVPESYLQGIWRLTATSRRAAAASEPSAAQRRSLRNDTEAQIRDAINGLLPEHIDIASAVNVTMFHDLNRPTSERSAGGKFWSTWRASFVAHRVAWTMMVAGGLLAGALTWFARGCSAGLDPQLTLPIPAQARSAEAHLSLGDETPDVDDAALRATLTELVREDPDGAAEILHRWMDKAG